MLGRPLFRVQLHLCRISTSSTPKSCMACKAPWSSDWSRKTPTRIVPLPVCFDVEVQSLECGNECISQLTAYADLIGEALSASRHDREVAAWPMVAAAQITMTSLVINDLRRPTRP